LGKSSAETLEPDAKITGDSAECKLYIGPLDIACIILSSKLNLKMLYAVK
jgi:hypothetical protein